MERSLRATGCNLPLYIIPYNEDRFELPRNAHWLNNRQLYAWLETNNAWPACRKYACFLEKDFLYVDSDVCFLSTPESALKSIDGFVTSCTHWNNPNHTATSESHKTLQNISTTWQKSCFNSGQWACDQQLFENTSQLIQFVESRPEVNTLLKETKKWKDQPAINLLVNLSEVPITNLTLPPHCMESTWAGDYTRRGDDARFWGDPKTKPFLIHWAGTPYTKKHAISSILSPYISEEESKQLYNSQPLKINTSGNLRQAIKAFLRELKSE